MAPEANAGVRHHREAKMGERRLKLGARPATSGAGGRRAWTNRQAQSLSYAGCRTARPFFQLHSLREETMSPTVPSVLKQSTGDDQWGEIRQFTLVYICFEAPESLPLSAALLLRDSSMGSFDATPWPGVRSVRSRTRFFAWEYKKVPKSPINKDVCVVAQGEISMGAHVKKASMCLRMNIQTVGGR